MLDQSQHLESDSLILYKQAKIFDSISKNEKYSENLRQILLEDKKFDACKLFWAIDKGARNEITFEDLKNFIDEYDQDIPENELRLLFNYLDKDNDGILDWSEYLRAVLSKECSFYDYSSSSMEKINPNIAKNFIELLKQEIKNLRSFEKLKFRLCNLPGFNLKKIFKNIDVENKGFFDIRDIYNFMAEYLGLGSYLRAERVLRCLDRNADGKVDFREFSLEMANIVIDEDFDDNFEENDTEDKRRFYEDGSVNTESKERDNDHIDGEFLSHFKDTVVDYNYTPYTPNEFVKGDANLQVTPEVFQFGSDFIKKTSPEVEKVDKAKESQKNTPENYGSTDYKIEKINNYVSFNGQGEAEKQIDFSQIRTPFATQKEEYDFEIFEADRTLPIKNTEEETSQKSEHLSSSYINSDTKVTPSRTRKNLLSTFNDAQQTPEKYTRKVKKNRPVPMNSRRVVQEDYDSPHFKSIPHIISPPPNPFIPPWAIPPPMIIPLHPEPPLEKARREKNDNSRFNSVTRYSFSPYKDVTETFFYPSGDKITTTFERNNKLRSSTVTKSGVYSPFMGDYKKKGINTSTAEKSELSDKRVNNGNLGNTRGFDWDYLKTSENGTNLKDGNDTLRYANTEPAKIKPNNNSENNVFYSEDKNLQNIKKNIDFDEEELEDYLNFDNLNYERDIYENSLEVERSEQENPLLPSLPISSTLRRTFVDYLKNSLEFSRELEEKLINLSKRTDFSIFDFQKIISCNKKKTDFADFKRNMKKLSIFNEEAKCFELFGFLDKGRNGYISKVDLINTFTPFNQNYREHLFQKNSREIKEISEYLEDTKHLLRSIFKTFKSILDFEKKSKRDLYGYTRDFFEFLDESGDGYIYMYNIGDLLSEEGIKASYREICKLVAKWDRNRDGKIGFNEFIVSMNDLSL